MCTDEPLRKPASHEQGFTVIEVAVAAIITMVSLVFLASLFVLALSQNKMVKKHASTTMLAQQKLEQLNALESNDVKLNIGGGLSEATKQDLYNDTLDDKGEPLQGSAIASYRRFWQIELDPVLNNTRMITVRVVATTASQGRSAEETVLTTVRSW